MSEPTPSAPENSPEAKGNGNPPADAAAAARHKGILIALTVVLVMVPLILGTLRLLGHL
jgi:hypothetical protein